MEKQIQSFDGRSNTFPIKESCAYLEERKKKKLAIFVNYNVWNLKPQKRKTDELDQM